MSRIAFISDIHGNLPALHAVLADIKKRAITKTYCLGDLVGKGPNPVETIELIQTTCTKVISGNWELGINKPQTSLEGLWQQQQIGSERLAYLQQLPFSLDLLLSGRCVRGFHASAKSVFHRVLQTAPRSELHALFDHTPALSETLYHLPPDLVIYSDIHVPYMTALDNPWNPIHNNPLHRGRIVLNTGSVGLPYDGIPQASYLILEGKLHLPHQVLEDIPFHEQIAKDDHPAELSIQFIRVPYDIELAVHLAYASTMPNRDRYIAEIRSGLELSKIP